MAGRPAFLWSPKFRAWIYSETLCLGWSSWSLKTYLFGCFGLNSKRAASYLIELEVPQFWLPESGCYHLIVIFEFVFLGFELTLFYNFYWSWVWRISSVASFALARIFISNFIAFRSISCRSGRIYLLHFILFLSLLFKLVLDFTFQWSSFLPTHLFLFVI